MTPGSEPGIYLLSLPGFSLIIPCHWKNRELLCSYSLGSSSQGPEISLDCPSCTTISAHLKKSQWIQDVYQRRKLCLHVFMYLSVTLPDTPQSSLLLPQLCQQEKGSSTQECLAQGCSLLLAVLTAGWAHPAELCMRNCVCCGRHMLQPTDLQGATTFLKEVSLERHSLCLVHSHSPAQL